MRTLYVLTEAVFHTSYLIDKISTNCRFDKLIFVVRNINLLDKIKLDGLHSSHAEKSFISKDSLQLFNQVYGGLSSAEVAMIEEFGIPKKHCLSMPNTIIVQDFNCSELKRKILEDNSYKCAAIFLDCLLSGWWIKAFKERIINAHSAVLPYARGMFAIEQLLLQSTHMEWEDAVGATIHYVNDGIDKGNIITTKKLDDIWGNQSIWTVKGRSYMTAFELLSDYCNTEACFSLSDSHSQSEIGPLFLAKSFSSEKRELAENVFLSKRLNRV